MYFIKFEGSLPYLHEPDISQIKLSPFLISLRSNLTLSFVIIPNQR